MEIKKKQELELVPRGKSSYKIIIPQGVENKIRSLCKHVWDVEWSGILFYKVEGKFGDGSLTVKCVDILQMDTGSSTYTTFEMSPDVVSYITDHPDLLEEDIYQGLVHSHNNMKAFFSGTDTSTLLSEGSDMPHFVSLIVNNRGDYVAAITRRKVSKEIIESLSYTTWGGIEVADTEHFPVRENSVVEYFDLIIVNEAYTSEEEISQRVEEISKNKEESSASSYIPKSISKFGVYDYSPYGFGEPGQFYKESRKTDSTYNTATSHTKKSKAVTEVIDENLVIPYGKVKADPQVINKIIRQLITSCVLTSDQSKIDIDRYVNLMSGIYKKRFGTVDAFEEYAGWFVEYLITNSDDTELSKSYNLDESERQAIIAYDVIEALDKYPTNPWIKEYKEQLNLFII